MEDKKKSSDKKTDDWFWKLVALVGTAASIASLVISLVE